MQVIDLRSDTVTQPDEAMRKAMATAVVGDDVFGEDPTVNQLQNKLAALLGFEAGLFCPSGTMANQIAIKCHTQPAQEVICDANSHVYVYEGGGIGFLSSCQPKPIHTETGLLQPADIIQNTIHDNDVHKAQTALVVIENSHNRGGGVCYTIDELKEIYKTCQKQKLKLHIDGARIFNALAATGIDPKQIGNLTDTISVCLSKGLGAPVGSVLLGNTSLISTAKRYRKLFGGGMRQAGIIAAGGLYALSHNIEKIPKTHAQAQQLAAALEKKSFVKALIPPQTNIVIFNTHTSNQATQFVNQMKEAGILCISMGVTKVRMVTHLQITDAMIEKVILKLQKINL